MSKLTYRASYYALYAMFAIILIVLCLFFLGGDATGDAVIAGVDPEMWQPAQTDALLYLMYALFGIAIAATILGAIFQFGAALKDNPANAIKSLLGLVLLVVVLVVAWSMGALLEPFFYIIALVVDIYFKVVVVEVVLHWLIHFMLLCHRQSCVPGK